MDHCCSCGDAAPRAGPDRVAWQDHGLRALNNPPGWAAIALPFGSWLFLLLSVLRIAGEVGAIAGQRCLRTPQDPGTAADAVVGERSRILSQSPATSGSCVASTRAPPLAATSKSLAR